MNANNKENKYFFNSIRVYTKIRVPRLKDSIYFY
jgi:hypothetical protein